MSSERRRHFKHSWGVALFGLLLLMVPLVSADVLVDNDDGAPTYTETGTSWVTSGITGYNGGTYRTVNSSSSSSTAFWRPTFPAPVTSEIVVHYRNGTNRTASAEYTIVHAGGTDVVYLDQTGSGSMDSKSLGAYVFNAGSSGHVSLNNSGGAGYHIADAILFADYVNGPPVITGVAISPELPGVSDPVNVTATITDPVEGVASSLLRYSVTPGGLSTTVAAFDDGLHSDGAAGDSVYGAQIPAMPSSAEVLYRFEATDNTNLTAIGVSQGYTVDLICDPTALNFILAGQSNASGRGELDENTEGSHPRVLMFGNDNQWKVATEPVDSAVDQVDLVSDDFGLNGVSPRHGFSLRAAKEIASAGASSVHIIPCPLGATSIAEWRRGGDPMDRTTLFGSMNYRQSIAAPGGVDGLWWYQGEANGGSSDFIAQHTALVGEMREEMGANLPIIYVQLARRVGGSYQAASERQRLMETGSGDVAELPAHHMVVAFDLDLFDNVHIDGAGQREIGRRVGLATRQHILGESIDGTGPRLLGPTPLYHPLDDYTVIRVLLTQPINAAVSDYDNLFRAYDDGLEVVIDSVVRDPSDDSAILITLDQIPAGTVTLSYGDVIHTAPGVLVNAVKGTNDLPLPRFGPLTVLPESSVPVGLSGFVVQ